MEPAASLDTEAGKWGKTPVFSFASHFTQLLECYINRHAGVFAGTVGYVKSHQYTGECITTVKSLVEHFSSKAALRQWWALDKVRTPLLLPTIVF